MLACRSLVGFEDTYYSSSRRDHRWSDGRDWFVHRRETDRKFIFRRKCGIVCPSDEGSGPNYVPYFGVCLESWVQRIGKWRNVDDDFLLLLLVWLVVVCYLVVYDFVVVGSCATVRVYVVCSFFFFSLASKYSLGMTWWYNNLRVSSLPVLPV